MKAEGKVLYLTFDDGPDETATSFVLSELDKFAAKATFFCMGRQVEGNRDVLERLEQKGHTLGNHTFDHLDGWKVDTRIYLENVEKCEKLLKNIKGSSEKPLFRPPYGRMSLKQRKNIAKDFKIVMWSYMVGDFESGLDTNKRLNHALSKIKSGDIVLFHDSKKAFEQLQNILPAFLEHFSKRNYKFMAL